MALTTFALKRLVQDYRVLRKFEDITVSFITSAVTTIQS